jgi:hypothetical protein
VTEKTVKKLLCCGFRRTSKAMGQAYQCWWRICRDINVLSRFEYRMVYFLYPFVTYLLTTSYFSAFLLYIRVSSRINMVFFSYSTP